MWLSRLLDIKLLNNIFCDWHTEIPSSTLCFSLSHSHLLFPLAQQKLRFHEFNIFSKNSRIRVILFLLKYTTQTRKRHIEYVIWSGDKNNINLTCVHIGALNPLNYILVQVIWKGTKISTKPQGDCPETVL